VQKFSKSFDQTISTIDKVKGRMDAGQLTKDINNLEVNSLTGEGH